MPTYDYRCEEDHVTEVRGVKYEDRDQPQTCETCGKEATRTPAMPMKRGMHLDKHWRNQNHNLKEY